MSQGQVKAKSAATEEEGEGKESAKRQDKKGIVTRVKHILTIKSVERPKSKHPEVVPPEARGHSKDSVNEDEGYLHQDSLLIDSSTDRHSRLYDILSFEKSQQQEEADRSDEPIKESGVQASQEVKMRRPKVSKAAQVNEEGSLEDEGNERPSSTFFQRGSMLVSSVRSSIRKMATSAKRKSTVSDGEAANGSAYGSGPIKPAGTRSSCNESQDSGLGEDSDFDPNSSSLSARTPTPAGAALTVTSSRPSSSSLRKVSGGSSSHDSEHNLKKHVIIREPSLSALPSTNRKRRQHLNECCLETAKIYSRPARIPDAGEVTRRRGVAERGGSVSSQWDHLFQLARAEVARTVYGCDNFTLRLIFDSDRNAVRSDVAEMDSVAELARLIHTVYKVLFFPWIKRGQRSHLSMILHCVQNFLVIIVEMAANLDEDDRLRYSRFTRDLLASSEASRYSPLEACLIKTRTLYIDLWCSLLCLPFKEVSSPTLSLVEKTLMKRHHSVICEEDEGEGDNVVIRV